jgi:hypothetical protein
MRSSAKIAAGLALSGAGKASTAAKSHPALSLPKIKLGAYQLSRLILGSNPFNGFSYSYETLNRHMLEWATPDNVAEVLKRSEENGVNTWQFSHKPRATAAFARHRAEGGKLQCIVLSSQEMIENLDLLNEIARMKPVGIVHHGGITDRCWRNGEQARIKQFLRRVRDTGTMVGLSTHNPRIIETVEEQGWDVDFYMTCVYNVTRTQDELRRMFGMAPPYGAVFLPDDPERMYRVVRQTKKTCLAFKILAAGRLTDNPKAIDRAFQTAFNNIKPHDAVIVGMYPHFTDQVKENAERVRRILGAA